jgi:hypothetical protein
VSVYGQNVFSQKEVPVWCNKFKDGRTVLNDDPHKHRGTPRTSHNDENCVIVKSLITEGQIIKVREIVEVTGIAMGTVYEIISDLNFHKEYACWVPKILTKEHKRKRMAAPLENLCHYQEEGELFVESIIMGEETWVYEFTSESKRNSITWKHPHSPTIKNSKLSHLHQKNNGDRVLGL